MAHTLEYALAIGALSGVIGSVHIWEGLSHRVGWRVVVAVLCSCGYLVVLSLWCLPYPETFREVIISTSASSMYWAFAFRVPLIVLRICGFRIRRRATATNCITGFVRYQLSVSDAARSVLFLCAAIAMLGYASSDPITTLGLMRFMACQLCLPAY